MQQHEQPWQLQDRRKSRWNSTHFFFTQVVRTKTIRRSVMVSSDAACLTHCPLAGFGMLFAFSAEGCQPSKSSAFSDDLEKQKVVRVDYAKMMSLLLAGSFREVKWTATIALALLRSKPTAA